MRVWVLEEQTRTRKPDGYEVYPIKKPAGIEFSLCPHPNGAKTHRVSGFGYPLPSLDKTGLDGGASRGERARPRTASAGRDRPWRRAGREACGGAAAPWPRGGERERGDAGEGKIWVALLRSLLEKGEIWVSTHP